jgi:Ca2+-binding EF-hand superfamily protein
MQEFEVSPTISIFAIGMAVLLLVLSDGPSARAQSNSRIASDPMLNSGPPAWDANHDAVYTCDEWKKYADRLFTAADRNHDGNLDKTEFESIRKLDPSLAEADFGYFDENQDGKITRKEFVEKPSAFILRFDRNGDCRVTADEIKAGSAPKQEGPVERPRDRFH